MSSLQYYRELLHVGKKFKINQNVALNVTFMVHHKLKDEIDF